MAGSNSQQRTGKEQRGEEQRGTRSLQNSHPGRRSTSNSRRTFTGSSESTKGLQGSPSDQKQILKTSGQQVVASESWAVPRCTSPVPIKHTTPQLNLQIPGPQTRSRSLRQNPPALVGPVKIMKRHTSPYPTPASSPNGESLDGLSPPQRSETCPGPTLDLTGRYTEKMDVFLQSIRPLLGGEAVDQQPVSENGMEANPVPDFFVNPTHVEAANVEFGGSWMSGMSESPERDLMDNEFIGTLGSIQDLDEDMRNWLSPDAAFSEFMPEPEDPMQEVATPIVMLQSMDLDSATDLIEIQKSGRVGSNQFLNTPQSLKTLSSDSGSPSPARRQLFGTAMSEGVQERSASVNFSSTATLGATEARLESSQLSHSQMSFGSNLFGELGELTPPSSAHRSPSPSSALFIGKESTKRLAPESVEIIETSILNPMMNNPALQEFSGLCGSVKRLMQAGKFGSLRDVEKDLWFRGRMMANSSSSAQMFCRESMTLIRNAASRIYECDLYKRDDLVYGESYFTDKFAEIEQICADSVGTIAGSEVLHENQKKRNRTPTQKGQAGMAQKRKILETVDMLSPTTKRPMITRNAGALSSPFAARTLEEQPKRAFIKLPIQVQQKQQLEIQTQCLVQPLYCPQGDFPVVDSSFTIDQRTNNATAQTQYHNSQIYHNTGSGVLLPSAPFSVQAGYYLPPTPVSAGSAASAGFVLPVGTPSPAVGATGSTIVGQKSPVSVSTPNTKDEVSTFMCELCEKRFPRPCDLTKHKKTHERPFKCDIKACKYYIEGFPTNKECERHQNDIHARDSKEWKCEFPPCQYKSKRESNCKQHMEKAHEYIYKRTKRNPRRRDHGVLAAVTTRKRRNVQPTQETPETRASPAAQRSSERAVFPRTQPQESGTSAPQQEHNPFAHSFGCAQPPHVSGLDNTNLLEPGQIQAISDDIFSEPMDMIQSFYEVSPVTTVGSRFEDYGKALHGHSDTSPTLSSEDFFSQSVEQYSDFLSDYTDENGFNVTPRAYQQPLSDFPFNGGLDFGESSDCERQGETPD